MMALAAWEKLARLLRKRGWNYQQNEWLLPDESGRPTWRVRIQRCDEAGCEYEEISAERTTLNAAYRAVLRESEKARKV